MTQDQLDSVIEHYNTETGGDWHATMVRSFTKDVCNIHWELFDVDAELNFMLLIH